MVRTNLKAVSVYMTEEQHARVAKAAAAEHRTVSNYCLNAILQKVADDIGTESDAGEQRDAS